MQRFQYGAVILLHIQQKMENDFKNVADSCLTSIDFAAKTEVTHALANKLKIKIFFFFIISPYKIQNPKHSDYDY